MTHKPKLRKCPACVAAKMKKKRFVRDKTKSRRLLAKKFGDLVTVDHLVLRFKSKGAWGYKYILHILDLATGFRGVYPGKANASWEVMARVNEYRGMTRIKCAYTDRAKEFEDTFRDLGTPHDTSRAGDHQNNSLIERENQELGRGIRTILMHAGLPPPFWPEAAAHFTMAEHVEIIDGESAWFRRFWRAFQRRNDTVWCQCGVQTFDYDDFNNQRTEVCTIDDSGYLHGMGNQDGSTMDWELPSNPTI